ncbi:type 1 glutamine amidotransferase [Blastochloris viridis]|uniref:GMP synthase [glutamine-hydrolyzing] n=1 Tax=Blastochloris viridis TaxID=1079 RepID=A0A0H5BG17_BLAVI|nr:type 1 glutamine amidotransferase [Blastochloris viridis]ALK10717.1 GMP synthase [glutamine-hydrolyzing] [Blastochloris viridis]BAR99316.1 GMP synthase [glutamine-hydrolyzing] [Blastochloris viridis]CUU43379.1 GMP synthase [glutamine-hydrolyzing] [Blastochloris viridis]
MRFLVFQHLDVEHPGTFRELWREAGIEWDAVELDVGEPIPALERYDALIVMGGPMDVWQEAEHPWLKPEKAAIRRWVRDLGRPYLGVCLGHQLLAEALGGTVGRAKAPEVGLGTVELTASGAADPLFAGFANPVETFQWHGAEVTRVPEGGEVLAANGLCAVQALKFGRAAYGVQYHVEIGEDTVSDWEDIPEYAASLEAALGKEGVDKLAVDTMARLPQFALAARRFNDNFLQVVAASR